MILQIDLLIRFEMYNIIDILVHWSPGNILNDETYGSVFLHCHRSFLIYRKMLVT